MLLANFNRKEHLRHRAVSLRQHGFLVLSVIGLPSKVVMSCFPEFRANVEKLQYVYSFKYLGHIISSNDIDGQ